jgi:hypothetical protein
LSPTEAAEKMMSCGAKSPDEWLSMLEGYGFRLSAAEEETGEKEERKEEPKESQDQAPNFGPPRDSLPFARMKVAKKVLGGK